MTQGAHIYIGFDSKEVVAYHVLCQSILEKSSIPVTFTPISLNNVENIFTRERNPLQSTEFSFSRFLVPYLSRYEGWSLFADCDMLMRTDIAQLWELRDDRYAAMCVKHDYIPKVETKFLGQVQTKYEKKNWSSVILFNNAKCRKLDLDYVNTASGLELHQFKWLESDDLIGELPASWNWLVNEYEYSPDAKLVHFTDGGPYFDEYKNDDYAEEWFATRDRVLHVTQRSA
ncbi:glycosyl transferase [Sinorhizobium medicae]|jgi:lipopolysaccharide biosynthesis glycosyltransferase|uniref:Glycosyltransferase n=1 Tax=Sinorhizobium medicae TaxID=110321 RepID=A0A508X6U8_9HYPH|nr:glycosyl transferase [Sinorhizobium medicae]MBO1942071.1 glycosyltransferase [Sinorhizobium medicae]MDX0408650.1 glycosyltransferase [Sinorhizobium medicae]MDX0420456.1 glycosyltransferase [Sinorhizobium medicae]MDX0425646.1 glycosyltransferase [Sinorhizobium medicae]MDX0439089.1 glycosyltransferase [Sinorhizobium medicae]